MRWLVADSLYNEEAYWCGHLSSYSHYLREGGEEVCEGRYRGGRSVELATVSSIDSFDVLFALDGYHVMAMSPAQVKIAQVAAICSPMPWEVRKPDGTCAYDAIISSIPWMVDKADKHTRGVYMPLAFDSRARVCGMGVERDLGCIFVGTVGPNHQRRASLLEELRDVVTVLPPVFGREYFRTLARAKVVLNVHAEWAQGARNNMRLFEATGMGAACVTDGADPIDGNYGASAPLPGTSCGENRWREIIHEALARPNAFAERAYTLTLHTYESRIPQIINLAKELANVR